MDKSRIRVILIIGFCLMTLVHLLANILGWYELDVSSKILLVPWLIGYVIFCSDSGTKIIKYALVTALSFSWAGDCILIRGDEKELFFIGGLIAFLCAHLLYIFIFYKLGQHVNSDRTWMLVCKMVLPLYLFLMLYYLFPLVPKSLFPAIAIYALIISLMAYSAVAVLSWPMRSFHRHLLIGVVLFLISDSILAITKFGSIDISPNLTGFYIMSTYCVAQVMLTLGITSAWKHFNSLNAK